MVAGAGAEAEAPPSPTPPPTAPLESRQSSSTVSNASGRQSRGSRQHQPRKKRVSLKFRANNFIRAHRFGNVLADHYEIGDKIGEGGFGEVFAVVHKMTGADRAVKVIYKAEDEDEEFERVNAMIRNEFATVNSLDHPNLIKQYEMFEDEDKFMIVTDLYLGGELLDELETIGPFQEEDAALLMNHMLGCINYCHEKNVAHCDLKPENILLEENMKLDDIKIIDFGLAKRIAPGVKFKDFGGSSYYMSPQIVKEEPYTQKCDVWSCGVVAFLVLAGYAPFDGADTDEICDKIEEGELIFDDEPDIWDSVTDTAKDFIRYLLTYEEKDRPTAQEALQHPWLANQRKKLRLAFRRNSKNTAHDALGNMETFEADSKLKQATYALIASQLLLKEEKEKIDAVFRILDLDCSGRLSKDEVQAAYKDFHGQDLSDEEVDIIFKRVNFSGSGFIEYSEFVVASLLQKDLISDDKLRAAFNEFDMDGNGFIDMEELRQVLVVDEDIDDVVLQRIIRQVDKNGDNLISYDEFKGMMFITASQPSKTQKQAWSLRRTNTNSSHGSMSMASSISSFGHGSSIGETSLREHPASRDVLSIFDVDGNASLTLDNLIDASSDDLDLSSGRHYNNSAGQQSLSSITGTVYENSYRRRGNRSNRSLPTRDHSSSSAYLRVNYTLSAGPRMDVRRSISNQSGLPALAERTSIDEDAVEGDCTEDTGEDEEAEVKKAAT